MSQRSKSILVLTLFVIAFAPFLFLHLRTMSKQDQYQYWPFVAAAVAYLLWVRARGQSRELPDRGNRTISSLVFFALGVLVVAAVTVNPMLGMVSVIFIVAAYFVVIGRLRSVPNLLGIWLLLWLLVPPPFGLDAKLVQGLQRLSSIASSQVLDLLKINHVMAGNALEVPGKQFFVDEACSGIVSVMSIVAAGAIYVVWANRTALHSIVLLVSGIGWAVVMNIARIVTIAFAYVRWGWDLSEGTPHEILGLVLFACTFTALVSTDQLLLFLLDAVPEEVNVRNLPARIWNRVVRFGDPARTEEVSDAETSGGGWPALIPIGLPLAVIFALIGVLFGGVLLAGTLRSGPTIEYADRIESTTVSDKVGRWTRTEFTEERREELDQFGEYSKAFKFADEAAGLSAVVSFDYPFPAEKGWKELTVCYRTIGWEMAKREVVTADSPGGPWNFVRAEFENTSGKGYLWFSHFDGRGDPVSPPLAGWMHGWWHRTRRLKAYTQSPHLFQSQLWVVSGSELSEKDKQDFTDLYLEAREAFRAQFEK